MINSVKSAIVFIVIAVVAGFVMGLVGVDGITQTTVAVVLASVGTFLMTNLAKNRAEVRIDGSGKDELLAAAPPAGKAVLFLFRQGFNGMAVGVDVGVDGVTVAQLKSPACTRITLVPGQRHLSAKMPAGTGQPGSLEITAVAGQTLAVQVKQGMGKLTMVAQPDLVDVRSRLAKMRMVQPEKAEV